MDSNEGNSTSGLDALISAVDAEEGSNGRGVGAGRPRAAGDRGSVAEVDNERLGGPAARDTDAGSDETGAVPLTRDDSRALPLSAAVNPRLSCFSFAPSTTAFDDLVCGLRGLVVLGEAAASPGDRALARAVNEQIGRVQRAAAVPPLPATLQSEAHAAALVRRGQLSSLLSSGHPCPLCSTPAPQRAFATVSGVSVPPMSTCPTSLPPCGPPSAPSRAHLPSVPGREPSPPMPLQRPSPSGLRAAVTAARPPRTPPPKLNYRVIRLSPFKRDFNAMLEQIRDHWLVGDPGLGTAPLSELIAGSQLRAQLKGQQVFGTADSSRLSKYKKLADEASHLGGWEQFFNAMRAEKKRWDDAAGTAPRVAGAAKPRAFRWAEIVQYVNEQARARGEK